MEARNKVQCQSTDQCCKNPELGSCAEQQGTRHRDQGSEIGQGAHPHKDDQREHFCLHTGFVEDTQETFRAGNLGNRNIAQYCSKTHRDQQQRFEFSDNREIEQQQPYTDHQGFTPGEVGNTCGQPQFFKQID